jgi:cytochrome c551/c552
MRNKLLTAVLSSALILSFACQKKEETQSSSQSSSNTQNQVETTQQPAKQAAPANTQENAEQTENQQQKQEVAEETQNQENTEENTQEETTQTSNQQEETAQEAKVDGQQIFQSKGCTACHNPNVDTVGPSLKKIAEAYKGKKDELIAFLKGEHPAIVDPAKEAIMKPQINTTKALPDDQLEALADYILSF